TAQWAAGIAAELEIDLVAGSLVERRLGREKLANTCLHFSPDGRKVGFVVNAPSGPGDIFSVDWDKRAPVRWTESETGGLPASTFVEPELIRFPTFDSVDEATRTIPAFYYRPRGPGPFPVVVSIHGGPEGQERPWFNPTYQYWLNELGIAVLAPNVRGSDGYGKSYLLLDNGFKREDSVKDIGALLDWAAARPELDASRIGVSGASYGGYMSLASLIRYSDKIKAGVDIVGISNFVTFLKNTKEYRRDRRRAEYGDERDPAMAAHLQAISPTTLAGRIKDPLFVIQGQNDPRVPASEAEQIVSVARGGGQPVWYLLALDEGHGFAKKTNRDFMGQAVSLFWQSHLIRR
ncbi:MAG: alpha/beta fold hydrolase, partial [Elusimicrobiota bacterium]|nr:alpha/beta fold hydrolase [Elusimicrobiota bacterium]